MSARRIALALCAAAALAAAPAMAADKIRAGTAVAQVFAFMQLDVGSETGIFKKHDIDVEIMNMRGDAQLQQGMTAGSIDVALGSGPGLAFIAKGVPAKGIAAFAHQPQNLGLVVPPDSPIRSAADLKGKKLAVTTAGSLTEWLARETSRQQGWGPEGVTPVPLGAASSSIAAMKTGQVDGIVLAIAQIYQLESRNEGRLVLNFGNIAKDFHTHILFARTELIDNKKDVLRRFTRAFFESIAFMQANKADTVKIAAKSMRMTEDIVSRIYDAEIGMLSADGVFKPAAMEVLARSWVELGILAEKPDTAKLISTEFVPPR